MSFLSNFNILVGILLGPTDLLESNEDMTFSISVLSVGLTKKEILDLFLRKSEKKSRIITQTIITTGFDTFLVKPQVKLPKSPSTW